MNGTDTLIRQALQSLDREVRITQEDVAAAHHRFVVRRGEQVRRRRSLLGVAAAAVVAAVVAGGALVLQDGDDPTAVPAAPDPPVPSAAEGQASLTPEDLAGLWVIPNNGGYIWEFHADGTMSWMNPGDGAEYEPTYFQVSEGVLDTGLCLFRLQMHADGTMTGLVTGPDGTVRNCGSPEGEEWTFIRVSPKKVGGASAFDDLVLSDAVAPTPASLVGTFWKEGSGQVLLVTQKDEQLAYRLDDDGDIGMAPDDVGTAVLTAQGDLVLTSSTEPGASESCPPGASVTLTDLSMGTYDSRLWATPVRVMTSAGAPGTCPEHADLAGTWLRVI